MAALQRAASAGLQRAGSLCRASSLPGEGLPKCVPPPCAARMTQLRRAGSSCVAAAQGEAPTRAATGVSDPFVAAGNRLQNLLSRVGDGEEELVNALVAEEAPEKKMQTSVLLGGFVTVGAVVISTLCNKDPWGGASLSLSTLGAAAIGAAASLPFVLLRKWSWTPQAYKVLPALQDVHEGQLEIHRPWLTRMPANQVGLMMALEVLPLTLLLFPAAQGGIAASLTMYSQMLNNPGLATQEEYLSALALMVTAAICGVGRFLELGVSEEEYDLVTTASKNADRYYRTVLADMYSSPADAARAADAFRFVSQAWLQTKGEASLMAGVITSVEILLLGVLWHMTNDLAAPAVAAMAINWVDYQAMHNEVQRKDGKGARSSGSNQ